MRKTTAWYPSAVDFRKTFYILPNLFTLSSILCGFAAMSLCAGGGSDNDLYLAALAICFGFFFDTMDGRVARLTKTQTDLGRDLDSLADVITFGAAPALLVYKWGLTSFGRMGVFVAGLFICAGALRLARFNVLERRAEMERKAKVDAGAAPVPYKPSKYTAGLSIPPASSVLVLMVIVSHNAGEYRPVSEGGTAAIVIVLSLLMVSRVRFRSFKDIGFNRRTLGVFLLLGGTITATLIAGLERSLLFLVLVAAYIGLGFAEEVLFFRDKRRESRLARAAARANTDEGPAAAKVRQTLEAIEALEDAQEEEAVLRELGAFDEEQDPPEQAAFEDPVSKAAVPDPAKGT